MLARLMTAAWLTSMPVASQTPTSVTGTAAASPEWKVPRTPWGHPDLQGVWTTDAGVSVPLERSRESVIYEYACHEGNYYLANILKAARAEEEEAKKTAPRK